MLHTYKPGISVVTFNWFYNPQVGDVIVVKTANKLIIKRIQKVEKEKVFLKGDNTKDSKEFGWIKKMGIIGRVIFSVYPLG